jgi:hypothetical protein
MAATIQLKCFRIYFTFRHLVHFAFNYRITTYINIYICALMVFVLLCVFSSTVTFSGVLITLIIVLHACT